MRVLNALQDADHAVMDPDNFVCIVRKEWGPIFAPSRECNGMSEPDKTRITQHLKKFDWGHHPLRFNRVTSVLLRKLHEQHYIAMDPLRREILELWHLHDVPLPCGVWAAFVRRLVATSLALGDQGAIHDGVGHMVAHLNAPRHRGFTGTT